MNSSSKFVLLVEYDGTLYHGFQWQVGLPTIQNELEQAIGWLCGGAGRVMAASRTDAGVHASGQVVSFRARSELDTMTLVRALNHYLPEDIAVKAAYRVSSDFNVRGRAVSREYHYRILNSTTRSPLSRRFALFVPRPLNVELMNEACRLLPGEQDLASFASSLDDDKTTIRNVHEAGVESKGEFTVFRIVASSFLPHQVRSTVGLLIRLGRGQISVRDFRDIMQARRVGLAGPVAPACGLCL
ncbi:MAG: tRNA pseudouridine(38-40) synthase TruA, partial [Dehalococcoidia bacterium]